MSKYGLRSTHIAEHLLFPIVPLILTLVWTYILGSFLKFFKAKKLLMRIVLKNKMINLNVVFKNQGNLEENWLY